jgi:pilus assembly protein CpaE
MIAAIISRNGSLRNRIQAALEGSTDIDSVVLIPDYPGASEIRSLETMGDGCVAFVDFSDDPERALAIATEISRFCPSISSVGVNVRVGQTDLVSVVRAGISEVLPTPFLIRDVETAALSAVRKLRNDHSAAKGTVYAFLPAKPGAGSSCMAVYSALACSRRDDCRPLLLDFDIRLGVTSFVLKLDSVHSIIDAFENASRLDETLWNQLVSERENLDVLGSAPAELGKRWPMESFQLILNWARRKYAITIVDLPGGMEDFEIATLQQASAVFLVCGSDLAGLHMGRQKIQRLHSLQLLNRVSVVLNRRDKNSLLSVPAIEDILGLPVRVTVPADERSIAEAVQSGTGVNPKGPFGKQIEVIARGMAEGVSEGQAPRPKRKFIEYFSIPSKGCDPWRL